MPSSLVCHSPASTANGRGFAQSGPASTATCDRFAALLKRYRLVVWSQMPSFDVRLARMKPLSSGGFRETMSIRTFRGLGNVAKIQKKIRAPAWRTQ